MAGSHQAQHMPERAMEKHEASGFNKGAYALMRPRYIHTKVY